MGRRPGRPAVVSISSLFGKALLHLASEVGITQGMLARYLGTSRPQVTRWAGGREPIPPGQLPGVTKRIQEAVQHALATPGGPSKPALAAILNEVFAENLAALGFPSYATLRTMLDRLTTVSTLAQAAPDITPLEPELRELSGALNLVTGIMNDLIELIGLLDCPAMTFISGSVEDAHGTGSGEEIVADTGAERVSPARRLA